VSRPERAAPRASKNKARGSAHNPSETRLRMFVIELQYKVDLAQIDAHMKAHMAFLKKHYASGAFVASGRKVPREGGIILAVGKSRDEVERIAHEDPFVAHGLADVRVIEFRVSQRADDVQALIASEPAR
jgi:uncharacterized protein YciI